MVSCCQSLASFSKSIGALGDWQRKMVVSLLALSKMSAMAIFMASARKSEAVKSRSMSASITHLSKPCRQLLKQPDSIQAMNRSFCLPQQQLLLINFLALKPAGKHSAVWPASTLQNFRQQFLPVTGRLVMFDRTDRSHIGVWWWTVDKMMLTSIFLLMVLGAVLLWQLPTSGRSNWLPNSILSGNS